jgi:hypothetical protein
MTRKFPLSLRLLAALALAGVILTGMPASPAPAQNTPMVIAILDLPVLMRDLKAAGCARGLDKYKAFRRSR